MEHLFHPWHWVPVLAALPFLGALFNHARALLREKMRKAEEDEDHNRAERPSERTGV